MEVLSIVVIPGFLGGLVIALLLSRLQKARQTPPDTFRAERLSSDVINIAHIRVAGIGGLGLVAMALVVAVSVPRIGLSLAIGLILGALFASALILWRRRQGPMPSSGQRAGANTTLSIDVPQPTKDDTDHDSSGVRRENLRLPVARRSA